MNCDGFFKKSITIQNPVPSKGTWRVFTPKTSKRQPRLPPSNISLSLSKYSAEMRPDSFGASHCQRQMTSTKVSWNSNGICCCFWRSDMGTLSTLCNYFTLTAFKPCPSSCLRSQMWRLDWTSCEPGWSRCHRLHWRPAKSPSIEACHGSARSHFSLPPEHSAPAPTHHRVDLRWRASCTHEICLFGPWLIFTARHRWQIYHIIEVKLSAICGHLWAFFWASMNTCPYLGRWNLTLSLCGSGFARRSGTAPHTKPAECARPDSIKGKAFAPCRTRRACPPKLFKYCTARS